MATLKSTFDDYKTDFKRDTGMEANTNMGHYINYVNARLTDYNMQIGNLIYGELRHLPDYIGSKVAASIKK